MIKALLTNTDGSTTLVLGLSRENVNRLTIGLPISFPMSEVGQLDSTTTTVVIHYGETEQAIAEEMRSAGLNVGPVPEPQPGSAFRRGTTY